MFRTAPLFLSLIVATSSSYAQDKPSHHLVDVRLSGPAQLRQLVAMEVDFASCRTPLPAQRRTQIIADDAELRRLQAAGIRYEVLQRDLESYYADQAAQWPQSDDPNPPIGQGAMGGHYTLTQMESILDDLNAANPAICSAKTSIGTSIEGRPIWMVKISDNVGVDENEPEVLYDSLHHAREPLSMGATVVFMDWLVTNYGVNDLATFLVDEREMYFVPCVNPDGYEFNRIQNPGGGGLWRKNRRDNGDGTFGVDLNRNYATGWSAPNGGNSTNTGSEIYRGSSPFSEPEVAAVEAFSQARQFVSVFSTHTYTDVLLRPWGYQTGDPANVSDYQALGEYLTSENGIEHGSITGLLYIAAGGSIDHHQAVHGSFGWSAELGRADEGGFWPSGPTIAAIANRHQPMFRKHALVAGPALDFLTVNVVEASGNGNGVVEPGETGQVSVDVRNVGAGAVASALLSLHPVSSSVVVGSGLANLGAVPALSTVSTSGSPLTFSVSSTASGFSVTLRLSLSGDGRSQDYFVLVPLSETRLVVRDDFEVDRGFSVAAGGTATTGIWERTDPEQTTWQGSTFQPGNQTTPGGSLCWVTDGTAGNSVGSFDVDGGFTELRSPVMDLSHLASAELSMSLWYAESQDNDDMRIGVSRDGGSSWTQIYSRSNDTGGYQTLELSISPPLTDQMRIRVIAQDLNPSLVECAIDDFAITGFVADGSITLLASGQLGTTAQIVMHDAPAAFCFALASPGLSAGTTFPGVLGTLLLDPASTVVLPSVQADAQGRAEAELVVPVTPNLSGAVFHWQQAALTTEPRFGVNVVTLVLQ